MAGDGETRIPTGAVARHAASLEEAANGMDSGRSAAARVQLGAEAYGKICAFLPGLIDPVADRIVTALGESGSALRETASRSRASSTTSIRRR